MIVGNDPNIDFVCRASLAETVPLLSHVGGIRRGMLKEAASLLRCKCCKYGAEMRQRHDRRGYMCLAWRDSFSNLWYVAYAYHIASQKSI